MATPASERVQVVKPGQTYEGKQGFVYGSGASAENGGLGTDLQERPADAVERQGEGALSR